MTDGPKMADPAKVARALAIARIMLIAHENAITVEWAEDVEDDEVVAWLATAPREYEWPEYFLRATVEFRKERGDLS